MIWLYRFVSFLVVTVLRIANGFGIPKIREGLQLRKQPLPPIKPGSDRPIWIHASSGEFEYAKPLITALKKRHPSQSILVTYFSPTYRDNIKSFPGVDISSPLPFDLSHKVNAFLRIYQPKALWISRTDLWPEVLYQCKKSNVPVSLFSATLSPSDPKTENIFFRIWFQWLTGFLSNIFVVASSDAEGFKKIAPALMPKVVGDTRFDQVIARLEKPKALQHNLRPTGLVFVAGSTWPEDEVQLLPILVDLDRQGIRTILVPHESSSHHLESLKTQIIKIGLNPLFYSRAQQAPGPKEVLIVDQVGILAELYQWGHFAFVGGSYRKTVHSVMEPLSAGCITFVGPKIQNNREALEFCKIEVASDTTLSEKTPLCAVTSCKTGTEIWDAINRIYFWSNGKPAALELLQTRIRERVQMNRGATEVLLSQLLR